MSLFGKKEKEELARLKSQMSPDQVQCVDLKNEIDRLTIQLNNTKQELESATKKLENIKKDIIETDEAVLLQTFGIYTPHYMYSTSDEYKEKLKQIRDQQKILVKAGNAVSGNQQWQVNGSVAKGKKMVSDTQKLLMRAFNTECDDAIEHVKFNNIDASEKKIRKAADAISKLGSMMSIAITDKYVNLKIDELYLMHEYQVKKQQEKEEAKEARARQREEAKAIKELEEARRKLEKEQTHYENALSQINIQIENAKDEDARNDLLKKKIEIEDRLNEIDNNIKDVDYRAANQRAGYVYIISNIGAFGENVYKIGMTRRLEPQDRVDELGDASVPFNFDVHAMIFSDDAPGLETALHNAFADRKVNYVNQRREFFHVTLDEIKEVIKNNYDKTVEFVDIAPAEQFRESLKIQESLAR